jgi:hypothetical protein
MSKSTQHTGVDPSKGRRNGPDFLLLHKLAENEAKFQKFLLTFTG